MTEEEIALLIDLAIQLTKLAFEVAEEITGNVAFENAGDTVERVFGVICLIRKGANGEEIIDEVEAIFEVPPGNDTVVPFGQLYSSDTGKHLVEVITGIGTWASDTFNVQ